ncbi:MAG: glycogen debranching enzyme N-terminal domain-containing protein, partial [Armatimonadota bacterium]|nr:glycogen debranching enzyme N-terminal domain-containing protein [Armatimonadota bacterium]
MIHIPKSVLQDIETAFSREWLVTNGIGGYASSTITWANTRRYHGLLIASLTPPFGRYMLFSKVDEELDINGQTYLLGCNEYHDGTIYPQGHKLIDNFRLELGIPISEYQLDGLALKKQIWMEHEQNTVYILYELSESSKQVTLRFKPFFAFRGYHECQRG